MKLGHFLCYMFWEICKKRQRKLYPICKLVTHHLIHWFASETGNREREGTDGRGWGSASGSGRSKRYSS